VEEVVRFSAKNDYRVVVRLRLDARLVTHIDQWLAAGLALVPPGGSGALLVPDPW
jgi:hypothetical protein